MNVDVVIVTYNRLEKLKKALACYENQTKSFRNLIVVNNHSNDGTFEYLEKWKNENANFIKHVVNMDDNLGGSGGFYAGQKYAMSLNPDWIYLADDDAYAEPDMMAQFYKFCDTHDADKFSAICGAVYNSDGQVSLGQRSTYKVDNAHYVKTPTVLDDYGHEYFDIDLLSYVGPYLNVKALLSVGLVNPKYFIYLDDTEHSIRLRKYGKLICVPSVRVIHDEAGLDRKDIEVSWRDYYSVRNKIHMLKKHHFKAAIDTTMYALKNLHNDKPAYAKVMKSALFDAWLGRLGKHKIYKPGWEIKSKEL